MTYAYNPSDLVQKHLVEQSKAFVAATRQTIQDGNYIDVAGFEYALILVGVEANAGGDIEVSGWGVSQQVGGVKTPISGVNVADNPYTFPNPPAGNLIATEVRLHETDDALLDVQVEAAGVSTLTVEVLLFRPKDSREMPAGHLQAPSALIGMA